MAEQRRYISTTDENGSINISEDVVAAIVAAAATEVKGVHGLYYSSSREDALKIKRKDISRSVRLTIDKNDIAVDVYILLSKDYCANEVGHDVQKAIISAALDSANVTVREVNVHICGVILKTKPQPPAETPKES